MLTNGENKKKTKTQLQTLQMSLQIRKVQTTIASSTMANNKLLLHHNLFALQLQHHTYN
jgi:hypothetical protein